MKLINRTAARNLPEQQTAKTHDFLFIAI